MKDIMEIYLNELIETFDKADKEITEFLRHKEFDNEKVVETVREWLYIESELHKLLAGPGSIQIKNPQLKEKLNRMKKE